LGAFAKQHEPYWDKAIIHATREWRIAALGVGNAGKKRSPAFGVWKDCGKG
jgi:hypothetical protein